ncbi:hypothetical protein B0H12DRAFT_1149471 [Mycena haematopus]|nr:hypothetical protein B0H12DRAFT_1149471 [Mycena haematopus]
MSAPSTKTQKPLLLPGISPHLFQSRAPAHLRPQRKTRVKDSSAGPVIVHPRTSSNDSTVTAPVQNLNEIQAEIRALAIELRALDQRLKVLEEQYRPGTYIFSAVRTGITIWQRVNDAVHSFLGSLH